MFDFTFSRLSCGCFHLSFAFKIVPLIAKHSTLTPAMLEEVDKSRHLYVIYMSRKLLYLHNQNQDGYKAI